MISSIRSLCHIVFGTKTSAPPSVPPETKHRRSHTSAAPNLAETITQDDHETKGDDSATRFVTTTGTSDLATVKFTNRNHHPNTATIGLNSNSARLKSKSAPVFPKLPIALNNIPDSQSDAKNQSTRTSNNKSSYSSPIDRDTQRLREEMSNFNGDIYTLELIKPAAPLRNLRRGSLDTDSEIHLSGTSSCWGISASTSTLVNEVSRESLALRCPTLFGEKARFIPTKWLPNAHLQTSYVQISKALPPFMVFERYGSGLGLDWYPKIPPQSSHMLDPTPILLLVHGLNGSSNEAYVRSLSMLATQTRNYRIAAMNFRGCGGTPLTTPTVFDPLGGASDVRNILQHIRNVRAGRAKIVAVGWSLGANMILNYLGESKSDCMICGAAALSPAFHISQSIDLCSAQTLGMYGGAFALGLQICMYQNWDALSSVYDSNRVFGPMDLRELAMTFLAESGDGGSALPARKWADVARSCCYFERNLSAIAVPTLILGSRDDPITKPDW
ncbi:Alpha/Beta hydrolase protein [Chytriomyces cf. hyalinus JEL632]|nr:Alpha/Beta hydrolase protein [Chytriomyces cf. hyalinus JEL632]